MIQPTVSIIIPAYNVATYIGATLESVFAQTRRDFEVIVINDGSHDVQELELVLEPFRKDIIYVTQAQLGASSARNTGISLARGKYLAFLDGDDIWMPEYLETQIKFLEGNCCQMVYCDALFIGDEEFIGKSFMQLAPSYGPVTFESLVSFKCNIILSGTLVLRECVIAAGCFDPDVRRSMDYILWLRLLRNGVRIKYQQKPLLYYRVRTSGLSGDALSTTIRDMEALDLVSRKFELSIKEKQLVKNKITEIKAETQLLIGKELLLDGKFSKSRQAILSAYQYKKSAFLWIVVLALGFMPRFVAFGYRSLRILKKRISRIDFIS
jgi:glycosyltransferase involved in cell wall biosynthesis